MTVSQTNTMQQKPMITDIFVQGARKGFDIATKAMIPNLIMAFVLMPSIFIMGSQLQYMGRCLGVIGINDRMLYVLMTMPIVFAFITMAVMNILIG